MSWFVKVSPGINNIAIITVKGDDYSGIIYGVSKSDGIHFLESSILDNNWFIQIASQKSQY